MIQQIAIFFYFEFYVFNTSIGLIISRKSDSGVFLKANIWWIYL